MAKSGGEISKKTYRRYMEQITHLIAQDPDAGTKAATRLRRLAEAVSKYEKRRYFINHNKRKLRGDL